MVLPVTDAADSYRLLNWKRLRAPASRTSCVPSPRVAREQAFLLQRGAQLDVVLAERARDAEAHRAGLARDPAAATVASTSNLSAVSVSCSGCLISVRSTAVGRSPRTPGGSP